MCPSFAMIAPWSCAAIRQGEGHSKPWRPQPTRIPPVKRLFNYFLRGLVVVVPIGVTIWVCYRIFHAIDELLGFTVAGLGFAILIALVTLLGFLASTIVARQIGDAFDGVLQRLPF